MATLGEISSPADEAVIKVFTAHLQQQNTQVEEGEVETDRMVKILTPMDMEFCKF